MIDLLISRAAQANMTLSRAQAEKLQAYHRMLTEANARFNLTRVDDDPAEAIDRNYLDCILPISGGWFTGAARVVDVGSGAGFPGVPLAICLPETHFILMDSLSKRVEFLSGVISALQLNAEAVHLRAEDGARRPEYRERFDIAVARAVAPMNLLAEYLLPFVRVGGRMLAYKGPALAEELAQAQNALDILGGSVECDAPVDLPGRYWAHRLAVIAKIAPTPEKYPRKAGKPEKKPL